MKTLIVYMSTHHGNTEKIAKTMADVLEARLTKPHEIDVDRFSEHDVIGFGSGIYMGKHHKSLLNLVDKLPAQKNKKAFIFSTSGVRNGMLQLPCKRDYNSAIKKKLSEKGFDIIGEFSCRG
ncbi:MAG: flavodoxin domain-containing protein, partial [Candidatus Methanofastidiosia archaeon]